MQTSEAEIHSMGSNCPTGPISLLSARIYDWVIDDGRKHFGEWLEEAVEIRTKHGDDKISEIEEKSSHTSKSFGIPRVVASAGFEPKAPWCP